MNFPTPEKTVSTFAAAAFRVSARPDPRQVDGIVAWKLLVISPETTQVEALADLNVPYIREG